MTDEIFILIADDHPVVRQGLRLVIEGDPRLKVVAEADDGEAALAQIEQLRPAIAVLETCRSSTALPWPARFRKRDYRSKSSF